MIVVDQETGRVYSSYHADRRRAPASLAKLMTLYLVFDALDAGKLKLHQRVRVSHHAAAQPASKLYLRPGTRVSIRTLIYAMAVKSANDAAVVAAEAVAGSERRFTRMMTRKARELGMSRTVFRRASGLPARGQYTTARDMARLARAMWRDHRKYYGVFDTRFFKYGRHTYGNTNRLVHSIGRVDGLKTGYTRRARYNLVTSATNGRKRVVVVTLGASSSSERFRRTRRMLARAWHRHPGKRHVVARRATNRFASRAGGRRAKARFVAHRKASRAGSGVSLIPGARRGSNYAIQVVAGRQPGRARAAVRRARAMLPRTIRGGTQIAVLSPRTYSGRLYRGRIVGLSPREARKACRILRRRSVDCLPLHHRSARGARRAHAARQHGRYAVQVAAGRHYRPVRRVVRKARRLLPRSIRSGTRVTVLRPSSYRGRLYRARIVGMTRAEAKRACHILTNRHLRCLAIRHRG